VLEVDTGSAKLFSHYNLIRSLVRGTLKAHLFKDSVQTIARTRTFWEFSERAILIG
jgi:hypothetical protein